MSELKVILYARVSTDKQAEEGMSIPAQIEKLNLLARLNDYTVVDTIVDDGYSAKDLNRPGIQRALEMLDRGTADAMVIVKLDRLVRNSIIFQQLINGLFQKRELISVQDHINTTTATGRLALKIIMDVLEWERESTGERTAEVLSFLRNSGRAYCRHRYGREKVQDGQVVHRKRKSGGTVTLRPVQQEQGVIDRILRWRADGIGYHSIANFLNDEEIPPPRGSKWHPSGVRSVERTALKSPTA